MKITIKTKILKQALATVRGVVASRTHHPILTTFLLTPLDNSHVRVSATDLELAVQDTIPATVLGEDSIAIPLYSFFSLLKTIETEEISLILEKSSNQMTVLGDFTAKIPIFDAKEFPLIPEVKGGNKFDIQAPILRDMLDKTAFSMSSDETRPNLNGLYLERSQYHSSIRMTATDGQRLSLTDGFIENQNFNLKKGIILPSTGVLLLQKLLKKLSGMVNVSFDEKNLIVKFNQITLTMKLIDGQYPDYNKVIPPSFPSKISINRQEIIKFLERVCALKVKDKSGFQLIFLPNNLQLFYSTPESGEIKQEFPCQYQGKKLIVGMNYHYLLDVLTCLPDNNVTLAFKDSISPIAVTSSMDGTFLGLIMPMRL